MMIFHRWERIERLDLWRCVDADIGGVNSGQRCWPGCGAEVTGRELQFSGWPPDEFTIDALARQKGFHGKNEEYD